MAIQNALELYKRKIETGDVVAMKSFEDLYHESVDRDIATVKRLQDSFSKDYSPIERYNKQFADAFEAVMYEHIEASEWMGGQTRTIKTTPFDDIVNGIDLILEINPDLEYENPSHIALGIDVTFGSEGSLDKKFDKLKEKIKKADFPKIKYFQSGDFRGEKKDIPEIILGVSRELVGELAALYAQNDGASKKKLAVHPIQNLLAEQVLVQLEYFAKFAKNAGHEQFAQKVARTRALLLPTLIAKANKGSSEYGNDPVHQSIIAHVS